MFCIFLINCVFQNSYYVRFSENFHLQTKNIHNFFEDNTRFTPGIEAWSRATKNMGFRVDTNEILIPKGKGYDPTLTPVPNVSWYKSTKKILSGSPPPSFFFNLFYFLVLLQKPNSLVDDALGLKGRSPAFEGQKKHVFFATKNFLMIVFPKTNRFTCRTDMQVQYMAPSRIRTSDNPV